MTKRKAPKQVDPFAALPNRVQTLLRGQPQALAVYVVYLRNAGPRGKAQISVKKVAEAIGRSQSTVKRARAVLVTIGLIDGQRTRRTGQTWLPYHPGYVADWGLYQARKAAKEARETATHMDGSPDKAPPYGQVIEESRGVINEPSGGVIYEPSIVTDVSLSKDKEISNRSSPPSGARPSGPSAPSGSESNPAGPPAWAVADVDEGQGQEPKKAPTAPLVMKKSLAWHEAWQESYPDYEPAPSGEQVPDLALQSGWVWTVHNGHHIPRFDMQGWNAKRRRTIWAAEGTR